MANILSIDFDFFIPEKFEYDFGHAESLFFLNYIWTHRAGSFLASGKDIISDMSPVTDSGCSVDTFPTFLKKRHIKFTKKAPFVFAESHANAYYSTKEFTDISLTHVDAHHDCGYGKAGGVDCGNWIEQIYSEGRLKELHIIYPNWRKEEEEDLDYSDEIKEKLEEWKRSGTNVTVSHGLSSLPIKKTFDTMFMCRSGSWVPPWCDKHFKNLVLTMMIVFRRNNYQLSYFTSFDDIERPFSMDEVEKHRKSQIEAMEFFKSKQVST